MEPKKIAIFHNFMDNIGGAEIVGLTLARELKADFYTTNIDEEKIRKMGFSDIELKSIGKVPINAPFRQQAALRKFRKLNLENKYDFYIIDGDYSFSHSILDMLGIPKEHEEGAKDYNYDKEYETIEEQSKAYGYCRDGDIDVLNEKKLTAEEKYDILTNPSSYKKWWDSVRYRNKK